VSLMRILVAALLAALLTGALLACSSQPELQRPDLGATPEKLMLAALTKVKATDAQRLAVFSAYDSRNGKLEELSRRSREIVSQWHKLDRTAPDFNQKIETLSAQWAEVNAGEMQARGAYEHEVATQLTPSQWSQWQDYMVSAFEARRRAELLGDNNWHGGRD
jgi:hypothetical protein